jgi:hypothetical protein
MNAARTVSLNDPICVCAVVTDTNPALTKSD